MSRLIATASPGEVALAAATAKTVLKIVAPANHRVAILGWGVSFDGISPTAEPVVVRLLRQTTAGTFTSLTPVKADGSLGETVQTTAGHTATVEPTAGNILKRVNVHPQSGYEEVVPLGQEFVLAGGEQVGIECTAPAAVNVIPYIKFEE